MFGAVGVARLAIRHTTVYSGTGYSVSICAPCRHHEPTGRFQRSELTDQREGAPLLSPQTGNSGPLNSHFKSNMMLNNQDFNQDKIRMMIIL